MISLDTLKFYKTLQDLADKTKDGYVDFVTADVQTIKQFSGILYDSSNNQIVRDYNIDANGNKDILSYYGTTLDLYDNHTMRIELNKPTAKYIEVTMEGDDSPIIIIENGDWYFV